jgi:hypothetical protein
MTGVGAREPGVSAARARLARGSGTDLAFRPAALGVGSCLEVAAAVEEASRPLAGAGISPNRKESERFNARATIFR